MEVRLTNGSTPNALFYGPWNRVWDEIENGATSSFSPRADVMEDAEGYHFYFEMPGLKSESVDVRVEDKALVVDAERARPEWPKEASIHVSERSYGKLHRAFTLPEDAAHENIHAAYKDGVLEVTVPKRPETKPVKIKVELN
ncbi:MAG: Hsp20/alpha crystallin family protein [Candidatus Binataceae bacterium]